MVRVENYSRREIEEIQDFTKQVRKLIKNPKDTPTKTHNCSCHYFPYYGGYYNTTNNYYGSGYDSSSSSSSGLCDRLAVGFVGVAIIGLSMAFLEKVFFTRDRFSILSQKSSRMHPLIFKRVSSQNKRIQNSLVKAVSDVYRFARTKQMVNRGYQIAGIEGIVAGAMCLISAFLSCEMMASMLSVALVVAGIAFAIGVFTWGYDKSINHSYISTKEDVKRSIKLLDNSLMYSNIPIIRRWA